jgi:hypothetical protein
MMAGIPRYLQSQLVDTLIANAQSPGYGFLGHLTIVDGRVEIAKSSASIYEVFRHLKQDDEPDYFLDNYNELPDKIKKAVDMYDDAKSKQDIDINRFYKALYMIQAYFEAFPLWKMYFNTPGEALYFMSRFVETDFKFEGIIHKRIRYPYRTFIEGYLFYFIHDLFAVLNDRSNVTQHIKRYDPDQVAFEIIQMETFPAPLAYLSNYNRVTIIASWGGLSRESAGAKYRNLHETHYGILDPVTTPDRENAGVVLYLANNVELDAYGRPIKLMPQEYAILNKFRNEYNLESFDIKYIGV